MYIIIWFSSTVCHMRISRRSKLGIEYVKPIIIQMKDIKTYPKKSLKDIKLESETLFYLDQTKADNFSDNIREVCIKILKYINIKMIDLIEVSFRILVETRVKISIINEHFRKRTALLTYKYGNASKLICCLMRGS